MGNINSPAWRMFRPEISSCICNPSVRPAQRLHHQRIAFRAGRIPCLSPPQRKPQFAATCKIPYSKSNVSPRVGFAYSLDPDSKTVVRRHRSVGGMRAFLYNAVTPEGVETLILKGSLICKCAGNGA
jgi:hypothetical protein